MRRALACLMILLGALPGAEVAVWDPGADADHERVQMRRADWDAAAGWLRDTGIAVARLDRMRLPDADCAVAVMPAHHLPLPIDPAARQAAERAWLAWLDHGGVLVGLGSAEGGAWLGMAIAPADGGWIPAPAEPRFAWQVAALREGLGLRYAYRPELHDRGVRQAPTALLRRYWPEAPVVTARLHQVHHSALPGAQAFALYDAEDVAGAPAIPAICLLRQGTRTAILGNNPGWWVPGASWFAGQRPLTIALVRLALDLHAGRAQPDPAARRDLPADPPAAGPLRRRLPEGAVEPPGAQPLARWGRFDGTSCELAPPAAGRVGDLPERLDPGAVVRLAIPAHPGAAWLRVRAAFLGPAGLRATIDGQPVIGERLDHLGAPEQAAEVERCAFIPPGGAGVLELANPGEAPLWFDAVQVEGRPVDGEAFAIGWSAATSVVDPAWLPAGPVLVPLPFAHLGPPGDPRRWAEIDAVFAALPAAAAVIGLVHGTPAWMAEPASLAEAGRGGRPAAAVPRTDAWLTALAELARRHGGRCRGFQLLDGVDQRRDWLGGPAWAGLAAAGAARIRDVRPQAIILAGGSARQDPGLLDAWREAGLDRCCDGIAGHAFAGETAAWEASVGAVEGERLARGIAAPVWATQQGFPRRDSPPAFTGGWTPARQGEALATALARLAAAGRSWILVYAATEAEHPFSLGPSAAAVMADWRRLDGTRRLDPQVVAGDGGLLHGAHVLAGARPDGGIIAVVEPGAAPGRLRLVLPLPDPRPRRASLGGRALPEPRVQVAGATAWCELELVPAGRAVLEVELR